MKAFMFPGQGSQKKGMGKELFDEFETLINTADEILGYSIKELCLSDPRKELNSTRFTQPALYVVNALSYYKKLEQEGEPDFLIGHSLGEFNALLAAECYDFETGLKLVKKRGELMSQAPKGGMAAILNATKENIERILQKNNLKNIDLANFNTPLQTVISGKVEEIAEAQKYFQEGEMLYYPLNTSGAFHSRFMASAQEVFEVYLNTFEFFNPKIPVISNVTARPYMPGKVVENLSAQIVSGVRWSGSIQYLMTSAENKSIRFEEVGHGDTLTKMMTKIKEQTPSSIGTVNLDEHNNYSAVDADKQWVPASFSKAEDKIAVWNRLFNVGTKVKSTLLDKDGLQTRSEAVLLFGHRAAVYIKGYNGYFDLDEIFPG